MAAKSSAIWILPDQLTLEHPALIQAARGNDSLRLHVVLVESREWLSRLPYHRKRQVLILSAGRHFAEELRGLGHHVDVVTADDFAAGLKRYVRETEIKRLDTMAAADYDLRRLQELTLARALDIEIRVLPNTQFLVGRFNPIPRPEPGKRYVMESFYRSMRKHFKILIEQDGSPTGDDWNFDAKNRKSLPKSVKPPQRLTFEPDAVTRSVMAEVEDWGGGVGSVSDFDYPVTRQEARAAFDDFLAHRLPLFGPYEDAMNADNGVLFHSTLSPAMNLGLLDPEIMARDAEAEFRAGRAPVSSVEGFIRQIIGWREFIYWQYQRQMPGLREANSWKATRGLPRFFWDGKTEMRCIRTVVERLIDTGYTHHIERLMILCNFCLLTGVDPAEVADWFLTFYVDAHDWVVLPNVIGMGLNADGGLTATKPYVASAAYIHKMSDFCKTCRFDPKKKTGDDACPFNALYWNFLIEHETVLRKNPRLGPAVLGLNRLDTTERQQLVAEAQRFLGTLEPYETRETGVDS